MNDVSLIKEKIDKGETIKLNLGVGARVVHGFIGVDLGGNKKDVTCDLTELASLIPNNSVDEIYSRHVVEHFPRKEAPGIIKDWCSLLKPGGKITLNFPNLDLYIDYYIANRSRIPMEEFGRWVYGNQKDQYDVHKVAYNEDYMSRILNDAGMKVISIETSPVGNAVSPDEFAMIGTEIVAIKK